MIKRLSHVGHLVRYLDQALALYADLFGLRPSLTVELSEAGVRNAMLPVGSNYIDLLQPLDTQSPIARALESRGEGFYHICLTVDDLDAEAESFRARGVEVILGPREPRIMFLNPRSTMGVLFELREEKELESFLSGGHRPKGKTIVTGLSHVGHAVRNLEKAVKRYAELFGLKPLPQGVRTFPELGIRGSWLPIGDNFIELFEPTDPNKVVGRFVEQHGEGIYAFVLLVDDVDASVARLRARGAEIFESPTPPELPFKRAFIRRSSMKGVLIGIMTAETVAFESGIALQDKGR